MARGERRVQSQRPRFDRGQRLTTTPTMTMTTIRFSGALELHLLTTTHIRQVTHASDSKRSHHFENDAQSTAAIPTVILQARFLESPTYTGAQSV